MNLMRTISKLITAASFAVCCTLSVIHPAAAQSHPDGDAHSQKQLDVTAARADRKALVGANMHLPREQAARFWPLYEAYEAKMDRIEQRHAAEINAFAEHYETLTAADADRKLDEVIAIRQERLNVQKEFVPKFRAAISSIATTRFFQIDNKLNAMIQCDLAQALPLIRPGAMETSQ